MPQGLDGIYSTWQQLGQRDPFWAILASPGKRGGRWDIDEFYATGREEIVRILEAAARFGVPHQWKRALDFGCGAGRLAQALCQRFDECIGVDIADSMIELAQAHNKYSERCLYFVNSTSNLNLFADASFDCVCSMLVLQHMPPAYSAGYVQEFVRVLAPGGLLVFQVPSQLKYAVKEAVSSIRSSLPEGAYRASLSVGTPQLVAAPGQHLAVEVTVTNGSAVSWPAMGREDGWFQVKLGNHWLNAEGELLQLDDGRANLPYDLVPGAQTTLSISVAVPEEPGSYLLEFDMVQEMIAWFGSMSSPTCRVPVVVREVDVSRPAGESSNELPSDSELIKAIEMHSIPAQEVERLLVEAGGKLLDVVEDGFAGPEWLSLRYLATK